MNKTGSETLHGSVSSFIRSKIYDKELAAGTKYHLSTGPTFVGVARQTTEVGIALGQNPF